MKFKMNMYKKYIKPFFDFIFAFLVILTISPLVFFVSLLLLFSNHGAVLFLQKRPGINGKIFTIIKFKTMNDKKDVLGNLLPDSERLTLIGKFIRTTSLDEVPQLINVLKGEMSIIGPRPLLTEYLCLYSDFQKKRHDVKPGITGWAQINGRNTVDWETKFKFDVWYVENQSFILDLNILCKTIFKVFRRVGINEKNSATMEKFYGK